MAGRQNLTNRSNAFKAIGRSGVLSKVYGAARKKFGQRNENQPTAKAQQQAQAQIDILGNEGGMRQREAGGFRDMASNLSGQVQVAPDFRENMQRAEEQRQRTTAPPAPTQPPIQQGPGYEQRDEPVFDQSAIATEEQIPGQSTPLPPPPTATNVSNRLARNRVTARQPNEDIPPDAPVRSRGLRRSR